MGRARAAAIWLLLLSGAAISLAGGLRAVPRHLPSEARLALTLDESQRIERHFSGRMDFVRKARELLSEGRVFFGTAGNPQAAEQLLELRVLLYPPVMISVTPSMLTGANADAALPDSMLIALESDDLGVFADRFFLEATAAGGRWRLYSHTEGRAE